MEKVNFADKEKSFQFSPPLFYTELNLLVCISTCVHLRIYSHPHHCASVQSQAILAILDLEIEDLAFHIYLFLLAP